MQNWAVMESEYRQVQEECQDLQALLEQRDDQLCTLNQDLLDLTLRMKVLLSSSPAIPLLYMLLYLLLPLPSLLLLSLSEETASSRKS